MADLIKPSRRAFLGGAIASLITAPAIVRAASLMPLKGFKFQTDPNVYLEFDVMEGLVHRIEHTLIYGNPEFTPMQFTGLAPLWSDRR